MVGSGLKNRKLHMFRVYFPELLGIGEDGVISFEDFNKRILREGSAPYYQLLFRQICNRLSKRCICSTLHKEKYGFAVKGCFQETDEEGNTKIYGIAETQDGPRMASAYQALQNSERILHNIYKNLPVGIELYNKDGYLIDLNKRNWNVPYHP